MTRKHPEDSTGDPGSGLPKEPPLDPRKPGANTTPGSHSTGGAKDHQEPGEGEARKPGARPGP